MECGKQEPNTEGFQLLLLTQGFALRLAPGSRCTGPGPPSPRHLNLVQAQLQWAVLAGAPPSSRSVPHSNCPPLVRIHLAVAQAKSFTGAMGGLMGREQRAGWGYTPNTAQASLPLSSRSPRLMAGTRCTVLGMCPCSGCAGRPSSRRAPASLPKLDWEPVLGPAGNGRCFREEPQRARTSWPQTVGARAVPGSGGAAATPRLCPGGR